MNTYFLLPQKKHSWGLTKVIPTSADSEKEEQASFDCALSATVLQTLRLLLHLTYLHVLVQASADVILGQHVTLIGG